MTACRRQAPDEEVVKDDCTVMYRSNHLGKAHGIARELRLPPHARRLAVARQATQCDDPRKAHQQQRERDAADAA